VVYKLYAQKRPEKMNEDDSPFYLAVNNNLKYRKLQQGLEKTADENVSSS